MIVIGGGPSGTQFGYQAARKGYSTLLIESKSFGRYKCCAGGISDRLLRNYKIPSKLIERKITSYKIIDPKENIAKIKFEKKYAATVNRTKFDQWLIERARDSGVNLIFEKKAKKVKISKDYVEVKLASGQTYRSRLLIGAFGISPSMLYQFEIKIPESLIGLQVELFMEENDIDNIIGNSLEFYFDLSLTKIGYAWIFPKKNKLSVGIITSIRKKKKKETLLNFIQNHPLASKKLQASKPIFINKRFFNSALIPNNPVPKPYGNRFLLLGDAAGFINPITWEGIYYAFGSADIAIETLNQSYNKSDFTITALSLYHKQWIERYGKEINAAKKLQELFYGGNMESMITLFMSIHTKKNSNNFM